MLNFHGQQLLFGITNLSFEARGCSHDDNPKLSSIHLRGVRDDDDDDDG